MKHKWTVLAIGALAVTFDVLLLSAGTVGHTEERTGWRLASGVERPSYDFIVPSTADMGIDSIVLTCNDACAANVLQIDLYSSGPLPLIPASGRRLACRSAPAPLDR